MKHQDIDHRKGPVNDCNELIIAILTTYPGTLFTKHPLISGPVKLTGMLTGMSAKF